MSLWGFSFVPIYATGTVLKVCIIANVGDPCPEPPAPIPPDPTPAPSTGVSSSGGGGGAPVSSPVTFNPNSGEVFFSGVAYPMSEVILLRDGVFLAQTTAGPDAKFELHASGITPGTYTYSIWSKDYRNVKSITSSFSVNVSPGVGTVISGIYLPPTIDVDKTQVKRGEPIVVLGASSPSSVVSILVHSSQEIVKTTKSDKNGLWQYTVDTLELEYGSHSANARWKDSTGISPLSMDVGFIVGDTTILKKSAPKSTADISGDGKINLVDFSIVAYWYKKSSVPKDSPADVNHDGKVDLKDFSVLAYYWTG
jgi:hypothetical protein